MQPVNSKSLFNHLCRLMDKLDHDEIDVAKAIAQSKLVSQATQLLNYELKRSLLMSNVEAREHHRNIEAKNFDSLPE